MVIRTVMQRENMGQIWDVASMYSQQDLLMNWMLVVKKKEVENNCEIFGHCNWCNL